MTPLKILKATVTVFNKLKCNYCLVGGHAASLYRSQERLTRDVDFAISPDPLSKSRQIAEEVIKQLGLTPMIGFIPPSKNESHRDSICMITSTPAPKEIKGVIDILLPELPWVTKAVERSQFNRIDLGFAAVPVIPPEDLIIAKCYALKNSPDRFQDLDDIKEIFQNVKDLDYDYLQSNLDRLNVPMPEPVRKYAR